MIKLVPITEAELKQNIADMKVFYAEELVKYREIKDIEEAKKVASSEIKIIGKRFLYLLFYIFKCS